MILPGEDDYCNDKVKRVALFGDNPEIKIIYNVEHKGWFCVCSIHKHY